MQWLNFLLPKNQNITQKVGFFISITLALTVLFLHYPFSEYTYHANEDICKTKIKKYSAEELRNFSLEDLDTAFDNTEYQNCVKSATNSILPFEQWQSNEPIIYWFGSVFHTLIVLVLNLILCICWLWLFQSKDSKQDSDLIK